MISPRRRLTPLRILSARTDTRLPLEQLKPEPTSGGPPAPQSPAVQGAGQPVQPGTDRAKQRHVRTEGLGRDQ